MLPQLDYDILIVGAGPAGLSTALHLARFAPHLAARTLVLEKETLPRPKVCAGGLTVDAEVLLERLDLDINEVPSVQAEMVHMQFAGRGLKLRPASRPALRIIRRDEFDSWLAGKVRQQGIQVREGVRVLNVKPASGFHNIETDSGNLQVRVVVGADGSNGILRACLLPGSHLDTARLLEVLTPAREGSPHLPHSAYFDFACVPNRIAGYTWDFPTQLKGRSMRCWGIMDNNLLADGHRPALVSELEKEMERSGDILIRTELKGHPIRWFDPASPFSVPGALLVGDAAGTDPLFGEGISMALGYGYLAAQSITRAFERGDFRFKNYRKRILFSSLGQTLTLRYLLAIVAYSFHWRWFQRLVWQVLNPLVKWFGWLFLVNWAKRLK